MTKRLSAVVEGPAGQAGSMRVRGRTRELALQVGECVDDRRSLESAITAPNCHLGQHSDGDERWMATLV